MIDWTLIPHKHAAIIRNIVGPGLRFGEHLPREPDETLAPDGRPYIYRWHVIPRRLVGGNVYCHLQVLDDPDRPLHDHPWDNQSVILAGGYIEHYQENPPRGPRKVRRLRAGDVAQRKAGEAHRLILLGDYSVSLFSTGPVIRKWGFWAGDKWLDYRELRETGPGGIDHLKKGAFDEHSM